MEEGLLNLKDKKYVVLRQIDDPSKPCVYVLEVFDPEDKKIKLIEVPQHMFL